MASSSPPPLTLLEINPSTLSMAQIQQARSTVALQTTRLEQARDALQQSVMKQAATQPVDEDCTTDFEGRSPQAEAAIYMGSMDYLLAKLSQLQRELHDEAEARMKQKQATTEVSREEHELQVKVKTDQRLEKAARLASQYRKELQRYMKEKNQLRDDRAAAAQLAVQAKFEERNRERIVQLQELEERLALRKEQMRHEAEERYNRYVERQEGAQRRLEKHQQEKCITQPPDWSVALTSDESMGKMQRGILECEAARDIVVRAKKAKSALDYVSPSRSDLLTPLRSSSSISPHTSTEAFLRLTRPKLSLGTDDGAKMNRKLEEQIARFKREKRSQERVAKEYHDERRAQVLDNYDAILYGRQERAEQMVRRMHEESENIRKKREIQEEVRESMSHEAQVLREARKSKATKLASLPTVDRWAPRAQAVLKSVCAKLVIGKKSDDRSAMEVSVPLLPTPSPRFLKTKSVFFTDLQDPSASFAASKLRANDSTRSTMGLRNSTAKPSESHTHLKARPSAKLLPS